MAMTHSKIALKGVLEDIPEDDREFKTWCVMYGYNYLGGDRRAWCPSFDTYIRDAKYLFRADAGFSVLLCEEDFEEIET